MTAFGMSVTEVQSQTCAACHDPHDATNPAQLRVYDALAALPNGLTGISGMGAGMICATCHNSRNGEHTDVATMGAERERRHGAHAADLVLRARTRPPRRTRCSASTPTS